MIKLFTIGFTEKSAETFFDLLQKSKVKKIIDVRLNNSSQLSGYAKGRDLKYFAKEIANIDYVHIVDLAPTKALLSGYRKKLINWEEYVYKYNNILKERKVLDSLDISSLDYSCFLCSEHKPDKCHRRLLVEYIKKENKEIIINHLF